MEKAEATARRRWFPHRKAEDRDLTRATVPSVFFQGDTSAGPSITARNVLAIADAWACARVLADSAASLPVHVYRRGAGGGRERVMDAASELLRRPAPATTQAGFIGHLVLTLVLHGNAFVAIYRDGDGSPQQLGLIAPETVAVRVLGGQPLYDVTANGTLQTVTDRDVIHIRSNMSLDGVMGISPVRMAREALGLSAALAAHGSASAANGARLAGVLTVQGGGPDEEDVMSNLERNFSARHAGAENSGKFAVLTSEVSFTPVQMPLSDAQFLQQREFSTREICRLFGVPPWMVGSSSGDSLTYSNTAEQARAFVSFSLRPWLVAIEQALSGNDELFPGAATYAAFELDGLLRGDPAARAAVYTQALDAKTGWMSRAEVRSLEDLPAEAAPPENRSAPAPRPPPRAHVVRGPNGLIEAVDLPPTEVPTDEA